MKKTVCLFLFISPFFFFSYSFAQIIDRIYYNQDSEKCIKEAASYYVEYKKDVAFTSGWKINMHLISGELYAEWLTIKLIKDNIIESPCEGEMKIFYQSGKIKSILSYANNILNGACVDYFENGRVKSTSFYKNGLLHDLYNQYDDKGKLISSHSFVNGTGTYTEFHDNFIKKYSVNLVEGKKDGVFSLYDELGVLVEQGIFKNDQLNGPMINYYDDGRKIKKVVVYQNDTLNAFRFECNDYKSCKIIIENNFFEPTNLQSYWTLSDYDNSDLVKEGLFIRSQSKKNEFGNTDIDLNIPWIHYNDFTIEAEFIIKDDNTEYGLYWNENETEHSYEGFVVNTKDQSFEIETFDGTIFLKKKNGQSGKIQLGLNKKNTLSISKKGQDVYYSVNGNIIEKETYKDFKFNGKRFSIYIAPKNKKLNSKIIVSKYVFKDDIDYDDVKLYQEKISKNNLYSYAGNGSGFFINTEGYIATNFHVIEASKEVLIETSVNGSLSKYTAEVIKVDPKTDLAILKINDSAFKPISGIQYNFSIDPASLGSPAFALGYPFGSVLGNDVKFTNGTVSSFTGIMDDVSRYQISTPIQPGNSGGPVFDDKCNLIGIVVESLNKDIFNESENVNFAIKSIYLKGLIDALPKKLDLPVYKNRSKKSTTDNLAELKRFVVKVIVKN
jgi:S1-C subfamily serine protease